MEKVWIVIPVYNEERVIGSVIAEIKNAGYENIIVIDDGSSDSSFKKASALPHVVVLRHLINRGKGAAVKTGIEATKLLGASQVVTIDGDGQHNPHDIAGMLALIREGADVVLGSRMKNTAGMPWYKIIHNHIGNLLVFLLYGLWVTDSQSGFRAYSRNAVDKIVTQTDRYEYDSEVIREIHRQKLSFTETPIEVRYTEYSMGKTQKMNLVNGVKTLVKMLLSS
jgi:glycosyltransferase involved in cell wall biosynthesis